MCFWGWHDWSVCQILGQHLNELVEFVLCWARPLNLTTFGVMGGTRTAVELAIQHNIPVYNLFSTADTSEFEWKLMKAESGICSL